MSIYVGSTEIKNGKLNVGGTAVKEVYVGSTKVWPVILPAYASYTQVGTYSWLCPAGVTSVDVVCIGGGGWGGGGSQFISGGGGGGTGWKNNIAVTPGSSYTVRVGQNNSSTGANGNSRSYFISEGTVCGYEGRAGSGTGGGGGTYIGTGGGNGGTGGTYTAGVAFFAGGGGGAGGYTGNGGNHTQNGAGGGGGGGGNASLGTQAGEGGGIGGLGEGPSGLGASSGDGGPGSGGSERLFGGGAKGILNTDSGGGTGAVAIRWGFATGYPDNYPVP